nr:MAG TPA: hypothetical protein [Caudoviricetes sp.]
MQFNFKHSWFLVWLIGCYVAKVTSQVAMCQELFYDYFTFTMEINR